MATKTWRGKDGENILITELDNHHLINAYKFSIRSICNKIGDLENVQDAFDDGHLEEDEKDFQHNRIRIDMLDLIDQKDALRIECDKRGIVL